MGIILISLGATIVGGIILYFATPILDIPKEKFITWMQQIIPKKKGKKVIPDPNREPNLRQLAQLKYNREREIIDKELNHNIRDVMERFSMRGLLNSSAFLNKAVELHTDRIRELFEVRKIINKEVFLNNKPIENNREIELALRELERIAESQKSVIFACERVFNQREKDIFRQKMNENITQILSNIQRDLVIEKE